jgi:D-alanyl-D-alanine carboxypeptidase (penicillin-binding protein 5/6)
MWKKLICAILAAGLLSGTCLAAPEVAAPSCILMDKTTGTILYESNAQEQLAPASVTKVMTLLLVMEAIDRGQLTWDQMVTASAAAAAKGGSQVYLEENEQMTVHDMVKCVVVASANDCATALAEAVSGSESSFVELMNQRAAELGMENTHFANCTGLDDEAGPDIHYTTAQDIAIMARELLGHDEIREFTTIWMDTIRDGTFGLSNTNKLVRFYSGTTGLKTGYTQNAGYCMAASAERDGMELIAVVMHCQTSTDRFESAKALLEYGFANYTLADPLGDTELPEVSVILGADSTVSAVLEDDSAVLLEKSAASTLTRQVELTEEVTAPVAQGQTLGTVTLKTGDTVVAERALVAAQAVARRTWREIFAGMVGKLWMAA